MTPKLADLIALCHERGIEGGYKVVEDRTEDPPLWRARIRVGTVRFEVPDYTHDAALERGAQVALDYLLDPEPRHGTREYVEWRRRRGS